MVLGFIHGCMERPFDEHHATDALTLRRLHDSNMDASDLEEILTERVEALENTLEGFGMVNVHEAEAGLSLEYDITFLAPKDASEDLVQRCLAHTRQVVYEELDLGWAEAND